MPLHTQPIPAAALLSLLQSPRFSPPNPLKSHYIFWFPRVWRRQRSAWRSTYCPLSLCSLAFPILSFPTTRRVSHLGIGGRRRGGKNRARRSKGWKKRKSPPFLPDSSLSRSKGETGKDGRREDPHLSDLILLDLDSKVSLSHFGLLL
nr:uncharacterized protein LOC127295362 [Lolium perenne]